MKRGIFSPIQATAHGIAALALLATIAFASGPAFAAAVVAAENNVEIRIQDMHSNLKITALQEEQWRQVANVMRDNDSTMEPLIMRRQSNAKTMTAIDDLNSYALIATAHAEGIKKFTVAFDRLYVTLSDTQKKDADDLFRNGAANHSKIK